MPAAADPYRLEPAFERACAYLAASRPSFWGRVGHAVNPACLALPPCRLAFELAAAIVHDRGKGPDAVVLVIQRARRWMDEGRVTYEQVLGLAEMFEQAQDEGVPDEDAVAGELVPLLRRRMQEQAAIAAQDDYKDAKDFDRTTKIIQQARSLGVVDETPGIGLDNLDDVLDEIARLQAVDRLPTGITDLDVKIGGGLIRGGLGMFIGGAGDGKSMALGHAAAEALREGMFVAYATLELQPPHVVARILANVTGMPTKAILSEPGLARPRLQQVLEATQVGVLRVAAFPALVSTFDDVTAWVEKIEERAGRKIDLLVTDYGDKLGAPKNAGKEKESSYGTGRAVFEPMRLYADQRKIWHWTASQAGRRRDKKRTLGLDDVADSMHKVRIPDLVVTLNLDDDRQMTLKVAKDRHGEAGHTVGPLPTDFETGRLVPVAADGLMGPQRAFARDAARTLRASGDGLW